jgi:ferrous iron transport protein B
MTGCKAHQVALGTKTERKTLALVGRPNVGKSALFTRLTGTYATCSNYPGTTVELFQGHAELEGERWEVLDTPGVLDLASSREDEQVTRDLLLFGSADVVLEVADAKSPVQALLLLIPLAELGLPVVLALNFADECRARRLPSVAEGLSEALEIPVIETVATTGEGIEALRAAIPQARVPRLAIHYGSKLEPVLYKLERALCAQGKLATHARPRGLATLLLSLSPQNAQALLKKLQSPPAAQREIERILQEARKKTPQLAYEIALARQRAVDQLFAQLPERAAPSPREHGATGVEVSWSECLARWTIHPVWGVLILLGVLYGVYQFVGVLGAQTLVDWLEETLFGRYINPTIIALVERYVTLPLVQDLLVGQYGIFTMALTYALAIILPIVTTFFLAFGFLEDSGYFPRLTVMAHRAFRKMGLSGQAVLPMILGLGCDTMATVTTRILETRRERVIATLLLALGVPCSAQMAVLLAISAAVAPWVLVAVLGIVGMQIFLVGRLAAHLLPGETSTFVMELPPLRFPQWRNILAKTRLRLMWYVTEVVPLFVLGTVVLFVLDKTGVLATLQGLVRPVVVGLLGLPAQAATAFLMGFFRRDYGAAGLYQLQQAGALDLVQTLVSLIVITLFVPCIANFLVIIKERGLRTALAIVAFVLPYAILVGALVNMIARLVQSAPGG